MNLTYFDYTIVWAYFIALLVLAFYIRRRKINFLNFALANRQLPVSMIFASLAATFIGPGYSLALSDKGFESGFLFFFIFGFFALQTLFTAYFLAPKLRFYGNQGCASLGDVIQIFYGQYAKRLVGIVSLLLSIGFTAIMAKVGGGILSSFLGISPLLGMVLITTVGLIYTATGGLRAVVATEAIQFVIILFAFSVLALQGVARVDSSSLQAILANKTIIGFNQMPVWAFLGLALAFFFGELLIPPYANRALSAKNENASILGFAWSGIFALYWFSLMLILGVITSILIPEKSADTPALLALASHITQPGLHGLILAALAAIVMSTQESVLNAGTTAFIREFGVAETTINARTITVIISLLALFFATLSPSVIGLLLISYSVWAPAVAIPLVWGLLGFKTDVRSGLFSMSFGLLAALFANIEILNAADNGLAILFGIGGNIIGLILAQLFKFKLRTL